MSAIELENAVQNLPPDELDRFAAWFEQFVDSQWDNVLGADVAAGRLDAVAQKADSDFEAGRCTPLRSILLHPIFGVSTGCYQM